MTTERDSLAASDPRRSAWVSANAGAGKTYTLANRVTRLLLDEAKPEKILCLTYTKAAAAEMEGRLFGQLGKWSMASDAELAKRIAAIGVDVQDAEGLRKARRLFALALETPGGLKIQTIHSFCQYLLARFPLEGGVPPAFQVLDDATAHELRDDARTRVLERAGGGDAALADAAALIVTETSETQIHTLLNAALGSERRKLERFFAELEDENALIAAVDAAHGARPGDTPQGVVDEFLAEMKREEASLRAIASWLALGTANDQKTVQRLVAAIEENLFERYGEVFLTSEGEPRQKLATNGRIAQNRSFFERLNDIGVRFAAAEARRRAAAAAQLAFAALVLIDATFEEYDRSKRARGALDYDDLVVATQRLLERSNAAQWVLYKLDGGLDHILIDEAQDTSPEQWAIVKALTEEFFAGSGVARDAPRTIFAVGDEKQSIFSFQGAEPSAFDAHRRHFATRIGAEAFVDMRLDMSRRSAPEVLRFVDQVFAPPDIRQGVTSDAEPIVHRAHRATAKGRVELWPLVAPVDAPEPDIWRPVDVASRFSPVTKLANQLASQVQDWTDGRKALPGRDRAISPGDIMVLMPRREPFATALIRALKLKGIPVAGADRIRLIEQIAVKDLIALGRFVLLPEDELNLAALLRSPLGGFSEDALYALCEGRSGTLWRELASRKTEDASFAAAVSFLSAQLARADFAPPYEFYAAVLGGGARKRLLARLGAEANDAIDEFLSLALAYEALNTPSLEGFLHWIEHSEAEVKRDMERGRDEVRVMTVHGAKGLEADIVILPDTASLPGGPAARMDILHTDNGPVFPVRKIAAPEAVLRAKDEAERKAREEHRRLLYVALTRARDRLYVCGFRGKKAPSEHSWYALAERAARDIGHAFMHGHETLRALGDAGFETPPESEMAAAEAVQIEAWATKPAPPENERPRPIRPSEAAGSDEPATFSPAGPRNAERFRRGNLIHALLARLPEAAPAARLGAALKYLAAQGIEPEEAEALARETLAVIEGAEFADAFAPHARAEAAIVADLPEFGEGARISGRIDRLAVGETDVLVVDFKTNRPPPARAEDTPRLYLTQMALYRAALARIFPQKRIACALVWTDGPSLMRLDDALLDREAERLQRGHALAGSEG